MYNVLNIQVVEMEKSQDAVPAVREPPSLKKEFS